jgi:hypothetical protein
LYSLTYQHQLIIALNNNVFMLGDLNLHYNGENKYIEDTGFNDLWLHHHSHFDGMTLDAIKNTFVAVTEPLENKKMRLDRILLTNSTQLDMENISMFADKKFGMAYLFP